MSGLIYERILPQPEDPLDIVVSCGVAYESDLKRVKAVGLEVMDTLRRECPGTDPESEPIFRYEAFGESNINFYMIVRARNRVAGFEVRSELIEELHSRLAAEGITINYPVRRLQLPDGLASLPALSGTGDEDGRHGGGNG